MRSGSNIAICRALPSERIDLCSPYVRIVSCRTLNRVTPKINYVIHYPVIGTRVDRWSYVTGVASFGGLSEIGLCIMILS